MFIPSSFRVDDEPTLFAFLDRHSFATLVTAPNGVPFASHIPLLLDRTNRRLLGHVARANPQWEHFDGVRESLAIFTGPHAYISPTWYVHHPAVPTWNYAAVHVYGAPKLIDDAGPILDATVQKYEASRPQPWPNDLPADYREKLIRALVAFEMPLTRLEGKFKFGQNRSAEDRAGTLQHLEAGDAEEQALAAMVRQHLGLDPDQTRQK